LKRGEIWTAAGGPAYAGQPRPVLIIQDDSFAETASVTVCLITTHALDAPLVRPVLAPTAAHGLEAPSSVMIDKITTLPRARQRDRLGIVPAATMREVNRAMLIFLGMAAR
jgi:mRNA interferase MazF